MKPVMKEVNTAWLTEQELTEPVNDSEEAKTHSETESVKKPEDKIDVIDIIQPFMKCLMLAGILSIDTYVSSSKRLTKFSKPWCVITFFFAWANIIRLLPSCVKIKRFNQESFILVVILMWYVQCGFSMTVCVCASVGETRMTQVMKCWQCHCKKYSFNSNARFVARVVQLLIGSYIIFVVCNVGLIAYIMFSTDPNMLPFTNVLYSPYGEYPALKAFLLLFQAYIAGAWILPIWLFVLVCIITRCMMEETCASLEEDFDATTRTYSGDLEAVRMHHEYTCDMVECADATFSAFVALSFATDIPLGCLVIYMMIWPTSDSIYMVIFNAFLMVMDVFHVSAIMWAAARVNSEAHKPSTRLHKITLKGLSNDTIHQLLVFMTRLQGPSIGLTAWQLFTIDKTRVLTLISIVVTYFIILIELRSADMIGG